MKRLFVAGKISNVVAWLQSQMNVYKDCTVAEFIADTERHDQAVKALVEAAKTV
ncbi:MAG: hypothetical protein SPL13_03530 [Clostridia bacterium]|nr:hypothetical protein [Clostridia bacterium]